MYTIKLKNNKEFPCSDQETIFDAAKKNNIHLEHSCLKARCSACKVKVLNGSTELVEDDLILSDVERSDGFILSCNTKPTSNMELDIEDLGDITLYESKVIPTKVSDIQNLTDHVIKVTLRLPPTANFAFNAGQYINLIKGNIKRSYSIAEVNADKSLVFYIKNYGGGLMSSYWFTQAKINDLLRLEGPLGTFFYRPKSEIKDIVFLATGTGIAPINAILQSFNEQLDAIADKRITVYFGARYLNDLFWENKFEHLNIRFVPVLSKSKQTNWNGNVGYVQHILLQDQIDLKTAQVYACGSEQMIQESKALLLDNQLSESNFYADAFICTN